MKLIPFPEPFLVEIRSLFHKSEYLQVDLRAYGWYLGFWQSVGSFIGFTGKGPNFVNFDVEIEGKPKETHVVFKKDAKNKDAAAVLLFPLNARVTVGSYTLPKHVHGEQDIWIPIDSGVHVLAKISKRQKIELKTSSVRTSHLERIKSEVAAPEKGEGNITKVDKIPPAESTDDAISREKYINKDAITILGTFTNNRNAFKVSLSPLVVPEASMYFAGFWYAKEPKTE
jgi:hypothetical protein